MLAKIKNTNFIKKCFILFLLIQPFLDLKILYTDAVIDFFHFSPSTIIRILMILFLMVLVLITKKKGKQEVALLVYTLAVGVYFVFHHFNVLNFDANITGTYNYSLGTELFYCLRMILPVYLIYLVYNIKLTKKDVGMIVAFVTFVFSSVIIVSNLFKFGIASYGGGALHYNVIDWFTQSGITKSEAGCQGLFAGANRLGVLLSALLPLNFYFFFTEKSNRKFFLLLIHILGTIIIGTQVATYTWILVMITIAILYLFLVFIKKINFNLRKFCLFILLFIIAIPFALNSPVSTSTEKAEARAKAEDAMKDNDLVNKKNSLSGKEEQIAFIASNYEYYYLNYIYPFEIYDFRVDPEFWIDVMNEPFEVRNDDRQIQELISLRLYELNDNSMDKYFGMGYSRFKSSDLYLEKDYIVHYYTMGLIGVILFLAPYVFVILLSFGYVLKNFKFDFKFLVYLCALCIMVLTSIICGHIVDEMITYIFMALLSGLLLREMFEKQPNYVSCDKKISVIIPVYNTEKYLRDCFDSVLSQNVKNLEVIVVNDCSTDDSLKICLEYAEKHDFIVIDNEENHGQAYARNVAIQKATGDYIAFLDSDDVLYDNNLEVLLKNAIIYDADLVMAKLNSFNSSGEYGYYSDKYINDCFAGDIFDKKDLLNCISVCSKIYKRDLIKNISFLEGTVHEDNSFTLMAYFSAEKIVTVPEYLYYRRIREGDNFSMMQNQNYKTFSDLIKNYNFVLDNLNFSKTPLFLIKYMIRKLNNYVYNYLDDAQKKLGHNDVIDFINKHCQGGRHNFGLIIYNGLYRKFSLLFAEVLKWKRVGNPWKKEKK